MTKLVGIKSVFVHTAICPVLGLIQTNNQFGLLLFPNQIFICELKFYTRAQLDRHLSRGDSEVDGSVIERGGFMGHPICDFCRKRFYGDNELYLHMSRDHYTCHICQR